jgi:inosose dehydratase
VSIRFGVSPIGWINDDMPELGADTSLEQVLAEARELGDAGIELGGRFPRDPPTLAALLGRVFIQAETSNAIHGDRARPLSATPRLDRAGWARIGAALTEVAETVAAAGLRFAYHHHLGTVVESRASNACFRAHPRRVAHVHCKDIRGKVYSRIKAAGGSFLGGVLDGMFTVPAESGHRRPASLRGARFGNFAA